MIVFLNKKDLLLEKLNDGITPGVLFSDYKGGKDYDKAMEFIMRKYKSLAKKTRKVTLLFYLNEKS